jgi:hypothetical protein
MYEIRNKYDGVLNNLQKNAWKNIINGIYYKNIDTRKGRNLWNKH